MQVQLGFSIGGFLFCASLGISIDDMAFCWGQDSILMRILFVMKCVPYLSDLFRLNIS